MQGSYKTILYHCGVILWRAAIKCLVLIQGGGGVIGPGWCSEHFSTVI